LGGVILNTTWLLICFAFGAIKAGIVRATASYRSPKEGYKVM